MKPRASLPPGPPRLPDPTDLDVADHDAVRAYLTSLTSTIATQLQRRPQVGTSQDARMFTAPDGKIWKVSVDTDGSFLSEPLGSTNAKTMPPV